MSIFLYYTTESAAPITDAGTDETCSDDDDDCSSETLAIAIVVTFVLTAAIIAAFVILVVLVVNTCRTPKAQGTTSSLPTGKHYKCDYELPEKS